MGEIKLQINPKNRPAVPAVNWQQARVLEMQEEYAAAFDTSLVNTIEEMRAAYNERCSWYLGSNIPKLHNPVTDPCIICSNNCTYILVIFCKMCQHAR